MSCCRQVAPRHTLQAAPAALQAEFALFAFWHEAPIRMPVNSHAVVAGASDCGLSVIESLLMHERLAFNALTLLAPGGLCSRQAAAMYKADLIARLVSWLAQHLLASRLAVTATILTCFVSRGVFFPDPGSWAENECLSVCLSAYHQQVDIDLGQLYIRDCTT